MWAEFCDIYAPSIEIKEVENKEVIKDALIDKIKKIIKR